MTSRSARRRCRRITVELLPDGRMSRAATARYIGCAAQTLAIWRDASEGVSQVINAFKPEWLKSGDGAARFVAALAAHFAGRASRQRRG